MRRSAQTALRWLALVTAGGAMFQLAGCARILTQEANVLFAGDASPTLLAGSFLVNAFGPAIRVLFS